MSPSAVVHIYILSHRELSHHLFKQSSSRPPRRPLPTQQRKGLVALSVSTHATIAPSFSPLNGSCCPAPPWNADRAAAGDGSRDRSLQDLPAENRGSPDPPKQARPLGRQLFHLEGRDEAQGGAQGAGPGLEVRRQVQPQLGLENGRRRRRPAPRPARRQDASPAAPCLCGTVPPQRVKLRRRRRPRRRLTAAEVSTGAHQNRWHYRCQHRRRPHQQHAG